MKTFSHFERSASKVPDICDDVSNLCVQQHEQRHLSMFGNRTMPCTLFRYVSEKCNRSAIGWWCGRDGMLSTRVMIGGQPRDKLCTYGNNLALGSSMAVAKWQIGDKG